MDDLDDALEMWYRNDLDSDLEDDFRRNLVLEANEKNNSIDDLDWVAGSDDEDVDIDDDDDDDAKEHKKKSTYEQDERNSYREESLRRLYESVGNQE